MMMDDPPFEPDPSLVARWRAAGGVQPVESEAAGPAATGPDALTLAAYADGRLDAAEAERVEAALAADPELLDTLLALRLPPATETPSAALIRSAQALVSAPSAADPVVVPFGRRPAREVPPPRLKAWLAWGAVAASLLLVSLAGFDLGMQTGHAVNPTDQSDDSPSDLLDLSSFAGDDVG